MKKLMVLVSLAALFASGTVGAQETTVQLPAGVRVCYEATTAPGADPNPNAHPQCNGVDPVARARIADQAKELAILRQRVARVEATASTAKKEADRANEGVSHLREDVGKVRNDVDGMRGDIDTAVAGNKNLRTLYDGHETRIKRLELQVADHGTRLSSLEAQAPHLTLRTSFVALAGIGADSYAGLGVVPGLSIGVGGPCRFQIEYGVMVAMSSPMWGMQLRPSLAFDLGSNYAFDIGVPTYGVGLTSSADSAVLFSGVELGVSKRIGVFEIGARAMPIGADISKKHTPHYALGGAVVAGFVF